LWVILPSPIPPHTPPWRTGDDQRGIYLVRWPEETIVVDRIVLGRWKYQRQAPVQRVHACIALQTQTQRCRCKTALSIWLHLHLRTNGSSLLSHLPSSPSGYMSCNVWLWLHVKSMHDRSQPIPNRSSPAPMSNNSYVARLRGALCKPPIGTGRHDLIYAIAITERLDSASR